MTTIMTSSRSKTAAIRAANHARRSRSAFLPVVIAGVVLSTSATPRPGSADWPQFGRPVTTASKNQLHSAAATDGASGAVITWQDDRFKRVNIFAGHVLASGDLDPAWPDDGQALLTDTLALPSTDVAQFAPVIVSDGAGGAIVAWEDLRNPASGLDLFAQHVLGSGVLDPAWPVHGRALVTAPGAQGRGSITTDGARGAIVAWTDGRVANTFHIFAQHVLATGAVDPAWPVDGRAISDAGVTESRPLAVSDGAGGAIVNWQAFTVHLNMFAQHVTAAGVVDPAWPPGGRALSLAPRLQDHADIASDGVGGAVVAWEDSCDVFAQHVLATGG